MLTFILLDIAPPPPSDIWHDSAFLTAAQIVAAFLILLIGYLLSRLDAARERKHKEITYDVILDIPLPIDVLKEIGKVERQDGTPIGNDTNVISIKLWNSGNVPIMREDYDKEIEFDFKGRELLSCRISQQEPERIVDKEELKTFFTMHPTIPDLDKVKLAKFLLDVGETITIQAVVTGTKSDIIGWARMNNRAKLIALDKRVPIRVAIVLPVLLGFTLVIGALRTFSLFLNTTFPSLGLANIVLIVLLTLILILATLYMIIYKNDISQIKRKGWNVKW